MGMKFRCALAGGAAAILFGLSALLTGIVFVAAADGATFYLDSETGDDARTGTSSDKSWRSLERANRETFRPGDRILFHAGGKWEGMFQPHGSGRERQPIVVDLYGVGAKPVIHGRGKVGAAI